jgi:hypothetical protein
MTVQIAATCRSKAQARPQFRIRGFGLNTTIFKRRPATPSGVAEMATDAEIRACLRIENFKPHGIATAPISARSRRPATWSAAPRPAAPAQLRTQFGQSRLRSRYKVFKRSWRSGGFLLRAKSLHGFYGPFLPHPRRDPSWPSFPAAREPLDLAGRLLGPRICEPSLSPLAHGGQRRGLAFIGQGAGAAAAVKTAAFLPRHRPLAAEAVTVPHAGATALFSISIATSIIRVVAQVNPWPKRCPPMWPTSANCLGGKVTSLVENKP